MGAELDQLQDGFLVESLEALESMERTLLQLAPGAADAETINTIFRVAHSIKGSAGMFGFNEIASLTHAMESLLHELRAGRMPVTAAICDGLLQAVDQLRAMVAARQSRQSTDLAAANTLQLQFAEWVATSTAPASVAAAAALPAWKIGFRALPELLTLGADPVRMFEELAKLGVLVTQADCANVPPIAEIDPALCHIQWQLTLATSAPREAIELIFDWACGNCELKLERVDPIRQATVAAAEILSIRVSIGKLDELQDRVGEIVATGSMLGQLAERLEGPHGDQLRSGLGQLEADIRNLQESVMRVRMLPAGSAFSRLPRLVRDLAARLGKQISLQVAGELIEVDKTLLEKIGDPLVHLVRNSVDHGIEVPEVRIARGKAAQGTVQVSAIRRDESIQFVISDDGNGLDAGRLLETARHQGLVDPHAELTDAQVNDLIFLPGFSTAGETTEVSGRGVGMDVVRRNIKDLGGSVQLWSEPGKGTTTIITLPLAASVDGRESGPICARSSA
jgi:two-component system chemotaxis sensor kinase CheA